MDAVLSEKPGLTHAPRRGYARLIITIPVAAVLLAAIGFSMSAYLHSQLLSLGQTLWDNYGIIRHDIPKPDCNPNPDIQAQMQQQVQAAQQGQSDSLLAPRKPDREAIRNSLLAQRAQCRQDLQAYRASQAFRDSFALQAFAAVEGAVGEVTVTGLNAQRYLLVLVILMCAWMASVVRGHVALRTPGTRLDCRVTAVLQLLANSILLASAWQWRSVSSAAGADTPPGLHLIWIVGFGVLALISLYQIVRPPEEASPGGELRHALLAVPLYTWMALVAGGYFLWVESYPSGIAVQLLKMIKQADLYLNVALYVWAGMLIKQTRLTHLLFDLVRPWQLAPELITVVVVFAAAIPTAITGASGILLVAVGAIIYSEIRLSGARRQLAFAATAMSGSMGVVLSPCLMVVIIAALNKQVTTTQLYGWGGYVFLLTSAIFASVVILTRRNALTCAPPREALPATIRALRPLLPYVVIGVLVYLFFALVLEQPFNEFTAPTILPVALLIMLWYDRRSARRAVATDSNSGKLADAFWSRVREATAESTMHIGALLMLMALSVAVGGIVERSGIMGLFPATFGSLWLAMAALLVVLVLIGMFMDPYGAIILVSATIATIAYRNGIDPVHFWMVVLVAFELGYLTPPVALNQLLTRQVVGEHELRLALANERECRTFWGRHEQILMPISVLATALLLVAFVPLLFY